MSTESPSLAPSFRDGTSQAARLMRELDPAFAPVDERTTRDLLAFMQAYAREVGYFDLGDPDRPHGDWSGLLGTAVDLDMAAAYAEDPTSVPAVDAERFSRPHVALLLAVLQLMGPVRTQLNTLTRRHLEFLYGDVLRMTRKRAVPDRVHVLMDVDPLSDMVVVPAGTTLLAGRDRLGLDLHYRTDREMIASRVQVAALKSLHAEIRVTGLQEASRRYLTSGTRNDAFLEMLRMALGEPQPGDPLPVPVYAGVPAAPTAPSQPPAVVTFEALIQVAALLRVLPDALGMPAYDDFRTLMRLKTTRQQNDPIDWAAINAMLAKAGRTRDAAFVFAPQDTTAFLKNLQTAIGKSADEYARMFDGLPEVKSLEEAYEASARRPDVAAFIQSRLHLSVADFRTLMQTRLRMEGQWDEINRLVEQAAQRKRSNASFRLSPADRASRDVVAKLHAAVGVPDYTVPGGLDGFFQAFLAVERYFYMPAEHVAFVLALARGSVPPDLDDWDWKTVYELLAAAHREKRYARRRADLTALAESDIRAGQSVSALVRMLTRTLDVPLPDPSLWARFLGEAWPRLQGYGVTPTDLAFLQAVAAPRSAGVDWARVATILEIAQRNREGAPPEVPRTVEWRNLYPAPDATTVASGLPNRAGGEGAFRWKTFGPRERRRAPAPTPEPMFGWAVTSSILDLSEGVRTIDLTVGLSSDLPRFDRDKILRLLAPSEPASLTATFNPFVVSVSIEDGWSEPAAVVLTWANARMTGYPAVAGTDTSALAALTFRLTLAEDHPPLTAPTAAVHGLASAAPVVRFLLRPIWTERDQAYVTAYAVLRRLTVQRIRLAVKVEGLKSLTLRNDSATLDPKQPFEPFGSNPAVGARFYLGHPELVTRRLDSLTVRMTWKAVPSSLAAHYANYASAPANAAFSARVSMADRGLQRPFTTALALFDPADATLPVSRTLTPPVDQGRVTGVDAQSADVGDWNRSLVWELAAPDFQHAAYPGVALQKGLEMSAAVANAPTKPVTPALYQVNPPVTPALKSLRIDYASSTETGLEAASTDPGAVGLLHIEPFGYAEVDREGAEPGATLLPQFDDEGSLYIGLRDVSAPQTVSLLFQMAEGSADPDLVPEPVRWSALSGNRWRSLHDGSLLSDGTRGFINSGIIEFSLQPVVPSTLLPGPLYWLRASIARSADSVCDTVDVQTNAAPATFDDRGNAPDHLSQPLPADAIGATSEPLAGLARVRQPYSSFGGKMAEVESSFHVRVSERLRHRDRAVTPWDYERLVLEKFTRLYKVKCLRADPAAYPRSPGRIDIIVIPDIRNRMPFDPFEPKAPADLIRDIAAFLHDKTPRSATVTVRNAHYVPVKVRCGVRFTLGRDEGFSRRQLTDELNRFLSPWAYDEGADVVIGGRVYANSIINFIEQREYVDYVAEFKLFTSEDEGRTFQYVPETDDYHAGVRGPDGVLVAAREHQFDVIGHADYRVEVFHGINYMQVGLDFIVA